MSRGKKSGSPLASQPRMAAPLRETKTLNFLTENDLILRETASYGDQYDAPLLLAVIINKALTLPEKAEDYLCTYLLEAAFVKPFSEKPAGVWDQLFTPQDNPIGLSYYVRNDINEKAIWQNVIEPLLVQYGLKGLRYDRNAHQMLNHYALLPLPSLNKKIAAHNKEVTETGTAGDNDFPNGGGSADRILVYENVRRRSTLWANVRRNKRLKAIEELFTKHLTESEAKAATKVYRRAHLQSEQEWQPLDLFKDKSISDIAPWYEFGYEMAPLLKDKGYLDIAKLKEIIEHDGEIAVRQFSDPRKGNSFTQVRYQSLVAALNAGLEKAGL